MGYTFMTESPDKEKYKVKWEGYDLLSHFSSTLLMPDVTLVTEDNIQRKTHRILLASISSHLKDLMLSTDEDVVIHLQGISARHLDLILEILNTGKTYPDTHTDETIEFLEVCQSLGINIFKDKIMFPKKTSNLLVQIDETNKSLKREIDRKLEELETLKKYKCLQCDRLFRLRSNLNHHIKGVHEKVRYPCQRCEKQCFDKRTLKKHNCKTGFKCSICDKSFKSKSSLYKHVKGIHDKLRFYCKLCYGNYSDKSNLRKHVLSVHENVKYSCEFCDKAFSDQSNLITHKREKHGICSCEETFQEKTELKIHRENCLNRRVFSGKKLPTQK